MNNPNLIQQHKFIVLCEDHYNPLTLIRSLGLDGISPIIVLIGENPYLIPTSKFARNIVIFRTIEDGFNYILEEYGHEEYKPFLYSCSDNIATLFDKNYSILKDRFYFFNGGADGQISQYMDKENIILAAEQCGLDIPKSERVQHGQMPSVVNFPIMTKSIRSTIGGWKNDVFICNNAEELQDAYKVIKSDPLLIEEFIEKKNELCVDGISFNGGEEVYMPFKVNYLRFTNKAYGNYMLVSLFDDAVLKDKIIQLFRKTKFSGIFSIEFLITPQDELKFLEINFRHSTWAISSRVGGADLPLIWANSCIAGKLDVGNVSLKKEPFTAMAELADFNDHVRHGELSLLKWIKDFHNCPCPYFYHPKDRAPFFATVRHSIKLIVNKVLKSNKGIN